MNNQPSTETNVNTENNQSLHPLKNTPFFGIPRHIALLEIVTDRLYRLLSVLCSAYGIDGNIEFKIKTLAALLQKGDRQTRELIKEAESKELIRTEETGRSLRFFLADIFFENRLKVVQKSADQDETVQKSADQVGGNPPISYKEQKNFNTRITTRDDPDGSAAELKKIRAVIDPEISHKISNRSLQSLIGIPTDRVRAASKEAMASNARSKPGLFITLAREKLPDNRLIPEEVPPNANEDQVRCIQCYNSNCAREEPTCNTIKPNHKGVRNKPGGLCKSYCPFVLKNIEMLSSG